MASVLGDPTAAEDGHPPSASGEASERGSGRIPGEEGIWVVVLGDMAVFAFVFGAIALLRADDQDRFEAAQGQLHVGLGVAATVLLLCSSWAVAKAVRAARDPASVAAPRLLAAALGCGVLFAAAKVHDYASLVDDGHGPESGDFGLYYFCFTGLHLLHVLIGLLVLGAIRRVARRSRRSTRDLQLIESGASYWHMVDLLWILLFALLYLV